MGFLYYVNILLFFRSDIIKFKNFKSPKKNHLAFSNLKTQPYV